jgi:TadE-like protein
LDKEVPYLGGCQINTNEREPRQVGYAALAQLVKRRKTMGTKTRISNMLADHSRLSQAFHGCVGGKGQALVEFTLVFILFLIIAWIPADFGLAFYTSQLAQNASREGARIAAATPTLPAMPINCTMPCTSAHEILKAAANRMSMALLPGAELSLTTDTSLGSCQTQVQMRVEGTYNYFFYQLLRMIGGTAPNTVNIVRETKMRWEHQC